MLFGTQAPRAEGLRCQHVRAAVLPDTAPPACAESWISHLPVQTLADPFITLQHNGDVLMGSLEVYEQDMPADSEYPLEAAAELAYRRLFHALDQHGYRHLWRTWNYMANINGSSQGLERYRQFNTGRHKGFAASARDVTGNVPAACALGVRSGPLSVAFIAGKQATIPIENPRQVSAYHYPREYGDTSPTFSRASLAHLGAQELLLLSGTASIVGHGTVHVGDVEAQTHETLDNIDAVLAEAARHSQTGQRYRAADLLLRVYIRHATHYAAVKQILDQRLGAAHSAFYLHVDVCRSDLDVEIEGVAWHLRPTSTPYLSR